MVDKKTTASCAWTEFLLFYRGKANAQCPLKMYHVYSLTKGSEHLRTVISLQKAPGRERF